jgi:hypothetical protein
LDDGPCLCIQQGANDAPSDGNGLARGQWPGVQLVSDAATVRVLQRGKETIGLRVPHFDWPEDVRVVEGGEQPRLLSQSVRDPSAEIPGTMNHIQKDEPATV